MMLKIVKTRNVETPARAHSTDAGIDFFLPKMDEKFKSDMNGNQSNNGVMFEGDEIVIPPGCNAVIPSGVKVEIPYGYMGLFMNKSGIASKKDLLIGACTIDTFYAGEVHIDLHNVGLVPIKFKTGDKLSQMALVPILACDITECDEEMLYDWMKEDKVRGENGLGSGAKGK